jgi:hypothetical protein
MDPSSEALMRSSLHDLANVLSGIRGILELSDPHQPLSPRDQARLEAVICDGMVALERSRHLAMGTLPESMVESGLDWRHQLAEQLKPLGILFRRRFEIRATGEPGDDRWQGELLRSYALALTRQVLPYTQAECLEIQASADGKEWRLRWPQSAVIPESLRPEMETRPRDISARWAQRVGVALNAILSVDQDGLLVRIPKY